MDDPGNYILVLRFLGTTPETSNIILTYKSILYQLWRKFNLDLMDLESFKNVHDLKDKLIETIFIILERFPNKKIVFLLDSIDQLIGFEDKKLRWMLFEFPSNIKFVFSTLNEEGTILDEILNQIKTQKNFLYIDELDSSEVNTILNCWLSEANRSLSKSQWELLNAVFQETEMHPLFVKLIFDVIVKWRSFYVPKSDFIELTSIDKIISYLFRQLEKEYGECLFSTCIFYLNAMDNGISENELENILSLDDNLLTNIFEYHLPPIRRFPMGLWARIKHAIREYIVEKEIDDTKVVFWYHRKFIEVSEKEYEGIMNFKYENAFDFFIEIWKNIQKPFMHNKYYAKKKGIPLEGTAFRYTDEQPLVFVSQTGEKRYNKRKLKILPHLISKLESANMVAFAAAEHFFFNYEFLCFTLLNCDLIQTRDIMTVILRRFRTIEDTNATIACNQSILLFLIFIMDMNFYKMHPENIGIQLTSRSLIFYKSFHYFKKLIDEIDLHSPKDCALIAPYQYLQPSGSGNYFIIDTHKTEIKTVLMSSTFLFTCSNSINVFSLLENKILGDYKCPILIGFDNQVENVEVTRAYFNDRPARDFETINEFDGGYLIMGQSVVMSLRFDNHVFFDKKFVNYVQNILLLHHQYVLVQFRNQFYFEIYNIISGQLVLTQKFKAKIKFILCNTKNNSIPSIKNKESSDLFIVLEKGEILKYILKGTDLLVINLVYNLAPGGIECYDCYFQTVEVYVVSSININKIALSFVDGSVCILDDTDSLISFSYLLPKQNDKSFIDCLKINEFNETHIVLIGKSGNIYFWNLNDDSKVKVIPGRFQFARINEDILFASQFGNVFCYIIGNKRGDNHQVYLYAKFAAHADEIVYFDLFMLKSNSKY